MQQKRYRATHDDHPSLGGSLRLHLIEHCKSLDLDQPVLAQESMDDDTRCGRIVVPEVFTADLGRRRIIRDGFGHDVVHGLDDIAHASPRHLQKALHLLIDDSHLAVQIPRMESPMIFVRGDQSGERYNFPLPDSIGPGVLLPLIKVVI